MDFSKLVDKLVEKLKMSETDAVVVAAFMAGGFTIDAVFFPGGIPPLTFTILSGVAGYVLSRFYGNSQWVMERVLRNLEKQVERGHLSPEKCAEYKEKIIAAKIKGRFDIDDKDT